MFLKARVMTGVHTQYMNCNIIHMPNCKEWSMNLMKEINTMINKKIVNIKVNKLN